MPIAAVVAARAIARLYAIEVKAKTVLQALKTFENVDRFFL